MFYVTLYRDQKPEPVLRFKNQEEAQKFVASNFDFENKFVSLGARSEFGSDGSFQRVIFDSKNQVSGVRAKTSEHLIFFVENNETFIDTEIERRLEGNPPAMMSASEMGKRGGSAKTRAKKEASRENGKLGGRPKKKKSP